jgi:hypothetical protein
MSKGERSVQVSPSKACCGALAPPAPRPPGPPVGATFFWRFQSCSFPKNLSKKVVAQKGAFLQKAVFKRNFTRGEDSVAALGSEGSRN